MSCGIDYRHSLDLVRLWSVWCRSAAAAPMGPLAWELPYAAGRALKKKKKKILTIICKERKEMPQNPFVDLFPSWFYLAWPTFSPHTDVQSSTEIKDLGRDKF